MLFGTDLIELPANFLGFDVVHNECFGRNLSLVFNSSSGMN